MVHTLHWYLKSSPWGLRKSLWLIHWGTLGSLRRIRRSWILQRRSCGWLQWNFYASALYVWRRSPSEVIFHWDREGRRHRCRLWSLSLPQSHSFCFSGSEFGMEESYLEQYHRQQVLNPKWSLQLAYLSLIVWWNRQYQGITQSYSPNCESRSQQC